MPTALIADDEPHLAHHLRDELAAAWPDLEVLAIAKNGLEAARQIADAQPDIAFLDIKMPGLTGLEVAQGIEGATRVVFVTAYDQYAVTAFEQQALDYLLKPVKRERLLHCVQRLRAALAPSAAGDPPDARLADALRTLLAAQSAGGAARPAWLRHVRASQGEQVNQVAVDDVLFFRADDKYTCVQTASAEHLIRTPISDLAQQLDPSRFAQVHRSTLVNLDRVAGTRRDEQSRLWLRINGYPNELPVSRAYVHLFKAM